MYHNLFAVLIYKLCGPSVFKYYFSLLRTTYTYDGLSLNFSEDSRKPTIQLKIYFEKDPKHNVVRLQNWCDQ